MSEHPMPWRVEADKRTGVHRSEHESLVGWNVVDANGVEIIGEEGLLADKEAAATALVCAVNERESMIEALREAERQIEYMHEKFQATGTGETVLARIRSVLATAA